MASKSIQRLVGVIERTNQDQDWSYCGGGLFCPAIVGGALRAGWKLAWKESEHGRADGKGLLVWRVVEDGCGSVTIHNSCKPRCLLTIHCTSTLREELEATGTGAAVDCHTVVTPVKWSCFGDGRIHQHWPSGGADGVVNISKPSLRPGIVEPTRQDIRPYPCRSIRMQKARKWW